MNVVYSQFHMTCLH